MRDGKPISLKRLSTPRQVRDARRAPSSAAARAVQAMPPRRRGFAQAVPLARRATLRRFHLTSRMSPAPRFDVAMRRGATRPQEPRMIALLYSAATADGALPPISVSRGQQLSDIHRRR